MLGRLDDHWRERPGGLSIQILDEPGSCTRTELSGRLADQAALLGLLEHIYAHGITLVRVERLESSPG